MGASANWLVRALRGAVLAVTAATTFGCSTDVTRPSGSADRQTAQRVRDALAQNQYVDAEHVRVDARGGVVRLSGKVASADELQRVLVTVDGVPGVARVDDQLSIEQFGQPGGEH